MFFLLFWPGFQFQFKPLKRALSELQRAFILIAPSTIISRRPYKSRRCYFLQSRVLTALSRAVPTQFFVWNSETILLGVCCFLTLRQAQFSVNQTIWGVLKALIIQVKEPSIDRVGIFIIPELLGMACRCRYAMKQGNSTRIPSLIGGGVDFAGPLILIPYFYLGTIIFCFIFLSLTLWDRLKQWTL